MPTKNSNEVNGHEFILTGIHMELTDALKNIANEKVSRLFRHEERIVRLRVELEWDKRKEREQQFIAKGHIEILGPNLNCSVASDDCMKALDLLVDKLDRMLRRRSRLKRVKRHRTHPVEIPAQLPKV